MGKRVFVEILLCAEAVLVKVDQVFLDANKLKGQCSAIGEWKVGSVDKRDRSDIGRDQGQRSGGDTWETRSTLSMSPNFGHP